MRLGGWSARAGVVAFPSWEYAPARSVFGEAVVPGGGGSSCRGCWWLLLALHWGGAGMRCRGGRNFLLLLLATAAGGLRTAVVRVVSIRHGVKTLL